MPVKIKRHLEIHYTDLFGKDVALFAAELDGLEKCEES
jgi:hypothetical protein